MVAYRHKKASGELCFVPYANEMFGPYARNALLASRRSAGIFLADV